MTNRFTFFTRTIIIGSALLLSACANMNKMAFQDDAETIAAAKKPIFLMSATFNNAYRPSFQPNVRFVHIEKNGAADSGDRLSFKMDEKGTVDSSSGNEYLIRMELDKGDYVLRGVTGISGGFPILGSFDAPLHLNLKADDAGVYYLGHLDATVRERNENEFRAGPVLPLIDQAVTGFSGGTFDIAVSDRFDKDESLFKSRFLALNGVGIKKAILPPFDRDKAQKWWDAH